MFTKSRLLLLFITFLFSCNEGMKEQPVTKEEAISFAKDLQKSFSENNFKRFDSILNSNVFINRVVTEAGMESNKDFLEGVKKGLQQGVFSKEISKTIGKDGSYDFLHHYEKEGKHHVVFRMFSDDGINYHDFELTKINDKITAADAFIYLSGENLSKTIASTMSMMMNYAKYESTGDLQTQVTAMRKIKFLMEEKNYAGAKAIYDKLPYSFRNEKAFEIINMQISAQLDDAAYQKVLEDFEKKYGNDASAQLSLLDAHFLKQDYKQALKGIDIIDKEVKDPRLNLFRAYVYAQLNNQQKRMECLELLYKQEPEFEDGVLQLLVTYLDAKQYDKAGRIAAYFKANKKFDQTNLETVNALYPEFALKDIR